MLMVKTKLGPSKIHGIGLFANENISKGTLIWQYNPELDIKITKECLNSLPDVARDRILHYSYYNDNENLYILCFDDARFFNHSETPNTIDDSSLESAVIAAKDIVIGEEITSNYLVFDGDAMRKLAKN